MDQIAILILTLPIMLPLVKALGFDPVWFGVVNPARMASSEFASFFTQETTP